MGSYQCVAKYKGQFRSWKWVWDGRFKCPSITTFEAESRGWKSKDGAAENAMIEYFKQVNLTKEQSEEIKKTYPNLLPSAIKDGNFE